MEFFGLNVIGIIIATIIGMVIGALWYSPLLFGKQWMLEGSFPKKFFLS